MQPHSRRTFLALGLLAAALPLTACTDASDGDENGRTGEHRRPDPDEPIRRRAVAATDTLLAGYDALLAGPGAGQAGQLQPLRAEVLLHRAALDGGGSPSASASVSASAPVSPSGTPSASTAVTTPAALAALERQTAQTRLADLGAASPELARLLASVSAAGLLHAAALGDATALNVPAPAPLPAETPAPAAGGSGSATPSTPPAPTAGGSALGTEAVAAVQSALSAEHAAVYGYGVVGARFPEDQQRADARTALAAHQSRRDAWQRLLTGVGATPGAAAAGYQLPFAVTDPAGAGRLAAHIETRLTSVYADLVAALTAAQRATAADALRESALRAKRWGAAAVPFPGIPAAATASPSAAPTG